MICFVDEDIGSGNAYSIALKMRGHQVLILHDATEALEILPTAGDLDLVLLDVMLARGRDPQGYFEHRHTVNGLETGLVLLDLLVERKHSALVSKVVLLSAATNSGLVAQIRSKAKQHAVPYWKKDFRSASSFCEKLATHLGATASG